MFFPSSIHKMNEYNAKSIPHLNLYGILLPIYGALSAIWNLTRTYSLHTWIQPWDLLLSPSPHRHKQKDLTSQEDDIIIPLSPICLHATLYTWWCFEYHIIILHWFTSICQLGAWVTVWGPLRSLKGIEMKNSWPGLSSTFQVEYRKDLENTKGHSINYCETPQFKNVSKIAKYTSDVRDSWVIWLLYAMNDSMFYI